MIVFKYNKGVLAGDARRLII